MSTNDYQLGERILDKFVRENGDPYKGFNHRTYNASWHWLHVVITILERKGYDVEIASFDYGNQHVCSILREAKVLSSVKSKFKIQATFLALVDFIKKNF